MDYEFDVFVSYRRGERLEAGGKFKVEAEGIWVHNVFLDEFRSRLEQRCPEPKIAIDTAIPAGADWEQTLQRWVLRSRCLVAVWSAPYFFSEYCRSEFHTMLRRQRELEAEGSAVKPVVPLVWADGTNFDAEAQAIQYRKNFSVFSPYRKPIENEDLRAQFVTALDELCADVERAVRGAPALRKAWKWQDKAPLQKTGFALGSLSA